jgi:hypothetical protein
LANEQPLRNTVTEPHQKQKADVLGPKDDFRSGFCCYLSCPLRLPGTLHLAGYNSFMRSTLTVDSDREQSLAAMWHAFRATGFTRRTRVEMDAGVVAALLNSRYYSGAQGQFITQEPVFWSNKQNLGPYTFWDAACHCHNT